MKILLVEDESELAVTLRGVLERESHVVDVADRIDIALEAARDGAHDLILLDRTLPDGDGLTLIPTLRAQGLMVPVIVLSARDELSDRIDGLDNGADDYVVKPFAVAEVLARMRAVARRPADLGDQTMTLGRLTYDLANDEAVVSGARLDLPRRELRVLGTLMRRPGSTMLREAIESAVYGFDDEVQSNTLDSHVSRLRRKLADADAGVELHAVRGVGYLLRATGQS